MFKSWDRCWFMPRGVTLLLVPQQYPDFYCAEYDISNSVCSKTTKMITISLILCHRPILRCAFLPPRPPPGRWEGHLLPAGSRTPRELPPPLKWHLLWHVTVGNVPSSKFHPDSGIRPVGKGGEGTQGKGPRLWST